MGQNKREIKFRAFFSKPNGDGTMRYNISVGNKPIDDLDKFFEDTAKDGCIWMQYTGLLDKNGKEIYEGDILLGRFVLDEVEDHIFLSLTEDEKETQSKTFVVNDIFYPYTNQIPEDLEVIGNIYENPNLLSEK